MKFDIFVELDTLFTSLKERVYHDHIVRHYLQQLCPPPPSFNQTPKGQNQVSALIIEVK